MIVSNLSNYVLQAQNGLVIQTSSSNNKMSGGKIITIGNRNANIPNTPSVGAPRTTPINTVYSGQGLSQLKFLNPIKKKKINFI